MRERPARLYGAGLQRRLELLPDGLDLGFVAGLALPVEREAIVGTARHDVDMQVRHALACAGAVGLHQIDARRLQLAHHRFGHALRAPGDRGQNLRRNDVERRPMALGDGKSVARIGRVDVHEGDRLFVVEQLEAGNLAGDDLAEDAGAVGRMAHRFISRIGKSLHNTQGGGLDMAAYDRIHPPGASGSGVAHRRLTTIPAASRSQVRSVMPRSRSLYFWILPFSVVGRSSTNSRKRGTAKYGMRFS